MQKATEAQVSTLLLKGSSTKVKDADFGNAKDILRVTTESPFMHNDYFELLYQKHISEDRWNFLDNAIDG